MDFRANINLKDLKLNWRKHVYVFAGITIVGFLAFMTFRSFAFLASQLAAVFQFDASQISRPEFDTENFDRIKYRLD
jgi:hypothetical protein